MSDGAAFLSGAVMMRLYRSNLVPGARVSVVDDEAGIHRTVVVWNGRVFRVDVVELAADDPLAVVAAPRTPSVERSF